MFGKRPRYDDTFGVRMDLGADLKDPHAAPRKTRPNSGAGKPAVLVAHPKSVFDLFASLRRKDFDEPARTERHRTSSLAEGNRASAADPKPESRAFETWALDRWKATSVQNRVLYSVIGGWILLATGLFLPAIVIAVVYFAVRRKAD